MVCIGIIVVAYHLGIVGGKAEEDDHADGADAGFKRGKVEEQTENHIKNDEENQSADEHRTNAGQVSLGFPAVQRHQTEVQRAHAEYHDKHADIVEEEQ